MSIRARFKISYPGFALAMDLDIPGRGITALFGASGSGKTTCLRAIAGLERAADGYLEINGVVWQDSASGIFLPVHRRPLGYVFQDANLFPHLSVRDNLEYGRKRAAVPPHDIAADRLIALLGLAPLLGRMPAHLSGGERQRVAIARALFTRPRLLLMDEPLAALDHDRKREILPYLEQLRDTLDIPVLYVSHAADEVARLADHLVVLSAGRVLAAGPLAATLARLDLPIRLGEDTGIVLDGVIVDRDREWHLARIEFSGGSLWVRDNGHPVGHRARVHILARDVSIAREKPGGTSILNTLPARVVEVAADHHPALALVKLDVGSSPLLARVTHRSAATLGLQAGMEVWVQIKAVALLG